MSALFTQICYGEIMKKLSLYIFLVLMFCNVGFAEDLSKSDINKLRKLNTEEIISVLSDKKLNGYYQFGTEEPHDFEEIHNSEGKYFQKSEKIGKISGEWEVRDSELCYLYYKNSLSEGDKEFKCGISVYTKYDMVYYFFSIEKQEFFAKTTSSINLN